MKKKLKLCPFCGSEESNFGEHPETCFLYRIRKQFKTQFTAYSEEEMEEAWNTRN